MKLLIINADDFGLNDAATDGILQAHAAGTVTSTTLMVNGQAAERAVLLSARYPELGVGLHFNLTWGRPVSSPPAVSSLVGADGMFVPREALARRLLMGRIPPGQIRAELQAQLGRMAELGLQPTHIDSHQHVHGFGPVFSAIAKHCATAAIPMRVPWVASADAGGLKRRIRRALLAKMLSRSTARWRGRVRWNDGLGSIFDVPGGQQRPEDDVYRSILRRAEGQAFELMVHPVTDGAAMAGYTRIGEVGEAEWRYLCSGSLAEVARAEGFRLGAYQDLAG